MNNVKLHVRALAQVAELNTVRAFWEEHYSCPDSSPEFFQAVLQCRQEVRGPCVLVGEKDGQVSALLLGRIEDTFVPLKCGYATLWKVRVRQLVFLPEGFLGERTGPMLEAMVSYASRLLPKVNCERLVFCGVVTGSALQEEVEKAQAWLWRDRCPVEIDHWWMTLCASTEQFLKRISGRHRQEIRRAERLLGRQFGEDLEYRVFERPEDIASFCRQAEQVAQKTYQRGLGVGFLNSQEDIARLSVAANREGWLGMVMKLEGAPVAFWGGTLQGHTLFMVWTGHDPELGKYEVGTILLLKLIEHLRGRGIDRIEMGTGYAKYKERFCDERIRERHLSIYAHSWKGARLSWLLAVASWGERSVRWAVSQSGLGNRLKKFWRRKKAENAVSEKTGVRPVPASPAEAECQKEAP